MVTALASEYIGLFKNYIGIYRVSRDDGKESGSHCIISHSTVFAASMQNAETLDDEPLAPCALYPLPTKTVLHKPSPPS